MSPKSTNNTALLARLFNIKVETHRVQTNFHEFSSTADAVIDYHYRHGVSHDEYEVRRIFDSGVAEFLFPKNIYRLAMIDARERQVARYGNHSA